MRREAIILAGGFGTRLKQVVGDVPKVMAIVGARPFLTYILDLLQRNKIKKVVLAVGYKHESISSYFGDKYKDIRLVYSVENEPLGTGGAILKGAELISSDSFFVINGDTFFDVDLVRLQERFRKEKSVLAVALKPMVRFDRYGTVQINNSRILSFTEKSYCEKGLINGGVYLLNKCWILEKAQSKIFSFEKDILERVVNEDNITYYISDTYFIDIGVPEDYLRASEELPSHF